MFSPSHLSPVLREQPSEKELCSSELRYIPHTHTLVTSGSISTYYQRSLGTPLTVPNSKETFIFLHETFCFLGFLSRNIFSKTFQLSEVLLRIYLKIMEFIGPWVHWKMYLFFPAVL